MKNVLLIDSGSGGINILKECVKVCPRCNFLMFCDNKNLPYGSKSKKVLQEITLKNLRDIYQFFKFDIVILACNTLTCTCLEVCRETFPDIIFIGTVPAVKPALEKFKPEDILVLATEATIKHNVLINKHPNLLKKSMPHLASDIDAHLDELYVLKEGLKKAFEELKTQQNLPLGVVLGCTHYVAIKDILQEIFGQDTEFFDSANGVARRLKHCVGEEENTFQVQLMVTQNEKLLPVFWQYYISN